MADDEKALIKHVKNLNKLDLVEKIQTKGDFEEIKEDFISAIEEIDDDSTIDDVDDEIIDYYESLIEEPDSSSGNGNDMQDKLSEMSAKELKAFVKEEDLDIDVKISKNNIDEAIEAILDAVETKNEEGAGDGDSTDDLEELIDAIKEFDDMDDLEDFIEEHDLDIKIKKKDDEDDVKEKITEALEKKMKASKKKGKKGKKEEKGKKGKKGKKDKKDKKGKKGKLKTGTIPALILDAIEGGDATWKELAEIVAEAKDKEVEQCMGIALRTVSRKISKKTPIVVTFNGDDETAIFNLEE